MNKRLYYVAVAAEEDTFEKNATLKLTEGMSEEVLKTWSLPAPLIENVNEYRTLLHSNKGSKHEQLFNATYDLASVLAASENGNGDLQEDILELIEDLADNLKSVRAARKLLVGQIIQVVG